MSIVYRPKRKTEATAVITKIVKIQWKLKGVEFLSSTSEHQYVNDVIQKITLYNIRKTPKTPKTADTSRVFTLYTCLSIINFIVNIRTENSKHHIVQISSAQSTLMRYVRWWLCGRASDLQSWGEVAGLNPGRCYFASRSTQPSIPLGSVNHYQLSLGRQRLAHSDCG